MVHCTGVPQCRIPGDLQMPKKGQLAIIHQIYMPLCIPHWFIKQLYNLDFGGKLNGSEVNLEYEILNIERIIDGLLSIPSV